MQANRTTTAIVMVSMLVGGCGICKFCGDVIEGEQQADVDNPETLDRDGFYVQYPGNWSVDDNASDYDPDHVFTIESLNCMTMFWIEGGSVDPVARADDQKLAAELLLTNHSESTMDSWGKYEGSGHVLEGNLVGFPATVTVFTHTGTTSSFTIMEQCYEEDMPTSGAGLELIRESFELKEN